MVKCKNCKNLGLLFEEDSVGEKTWCDKITDSPDLEVERNCEYYEVMTNIERIQCMDALELAKFLLNFKNTFGEEYEGELSCVDWLQSKSEE